MLAAEGDVSRARLYYEDAICHYTQQFGRFNEGTLKAKALLADLLTLDDSNTPSATRARSSARELFREVITGRTKT